jgi:hypothetical protein
MTRALFRCKPSGLAVTAAVVCVSIVSCAQPVERGGPEPPIPARFGHDAIVRGQIGTTLTKAATSYTPDEFRRLMNVTWNRGQVDAQRMLQIDQAPGASTFDPVDAGQFGAVIARVTNNGTATDTTFRVSPKDTVYLIVFPWDGTEPDPAGVLEDPVARLWTVDLRDTVHVVGPNGTYRICRHHYRDTPVRALPARFGGCDHDDAAYPPTDPRPAQMRGPAAGDGNGILTHQGGATNVHCPQGCCTGKT